MHHNNAEVSHDLTSKSFRQDICLLIESADASSVCMYVCVTARWLAWVHRKWSRP